MKINISQTPLNANGEEPKNLLVRTKRATKTETPPTPSCSTAATRR